MYGKRIGGFNAAEDGHGKRWITVLRVSHWRFRRAIGLAAVILAVLVVVAVGLTFSGWGIGPQHLPSSAPTWVKPAPAPVRPTPPIPSEVMLNGQYQLTVEDSQSTYVDSTASEWSSGFVDYVGFIQFSTKCTGSKCVATSTPMSDPNSPALGKNVETMVWASGEWSSRESPMPDGDGMDESSTILHSDGRRGFLGTTTDTIISGPHTGAQLSAPVVLTPRFDPANL
jgi:hypothetical protein